MNMFDFGKSHVPTVEAEEVKRAMDAKEQFVLIDVRTEGEYSRGKIQGSLHIPVEEISDKVKTVIPDASAKIFVYCLSGSRSVYAVEVMMKLGYTNVYDVSHGLLAWRAKWFPVVV